MVGWLIDDVVVDLCVVVWFCFLFPMPFNNHNVPPPPHQNPKSIPMMSWYVVMVVRIAPQSVLGSCGRWKWIWSIPMTNIEMIVGGCWCNLNNTPISPHCWSVNVTPIQYYSISWTVLVPKVVVGVGASGGLGGWWVDGINWWSCWWSVVGDVVML